MNLKYIMLRIQEGGRSGHMRLVPILFPEAMVHATMAEALVDAVRVEQAPAKVDVVSAGQVRIDAEDVVVHDRSESLMLRPHTDDARIIATINYTHGIFQRTERSVLTVPPK
jgi:hypothetical protein